MGLPVLYSTSKVKSGVSKFGCVRLIENARKLTCTPKSAVFCTAKVNCSGSPARSTRPKRPGVLTMFDSDGMTGVRKFDGAWAIEPSAVVWS